MEIKVARAGAGRRYRSRCRIRVQAGAGRIEAMDENTVGAQIRHMNPAGAVEMNAVGMGPLLTPLVGAGALVEDDGDGWAE
jgi:hypothetical protein